MQRPASARPPSGLKRELHGGGGPEMAAGKDALRPASSLGIGRRPRPQSAAAGARPRSSTPDGEEGGSKIAHLFDGTRTRELPKAALGLSGRGEYKPRPRPAWGAGNGAQAGRDLQTRPRPSSALGGSIARPHSATGGDARERLSSGKPPRPVSAMGNSGGGGGGSGPQAWGSRVDKRPASALGIRPQPGGGGGGAMRPQSAALSASTTRPNSGQAAAAAGDGAAHQQQQGVDGRPTSALSMGQPRSQASVGLATAGARRRPASALPKASSGFSGASLTQPLHPYEKLGEGMGSNIGLSDSAAQQLEDRDLLRRVELLKEELRLKARGMWRGDEEPRKPAEEDEEAAYKKATMDAASDSDDEEEVDEHGNRRRKVIAITDLKPDRMAELEAEFKGDDEERGLDQAEFEKVIAEYTGMVGSMSTQLFCKIDANDDGTVVWDEFLSYIVHDAKARLDRAKPRPMATITSDGIGEGKYVMAQPKDMVGCALLLPRHSLFATFGMIRREVIFWNADTYEPVGQVTVPSLTEIKPSQSFVPSKAVAGRSMAYLPSSQGTLYVASGTDAMILQYDCRRFKIRRELFPPNSPSCLCTCQNPEAKAGGGVNLESNSWLLVGDVEGYITCYDCKHHQQVGRYRPHEKGIQFPQGSTVTAIAMWRKVGVISCGDDGRVCIGDDQFWKVKNYRSDKRLKVVQFVIDVVSEAAAKGAELQYAEEAHTEAQRVLGGLRRHQQRHRGRENQKRGSVTKGGGDELAFEGMEKAEMDVEVTSKKLALCRDLFQGRSDMAMEVLGGKVAKTQGGRALASSLRDMDAAEQQEHEEVQGVEAGASGDEVSEGESGRGGARKGHGTGDEGMAVLIEDEAVQDVFQRDGWDPVKRRFDHTPDWGEALGRLETLKATLQKAEEQNMRPMVLSTGVSQSCIAVSEACKLVIVGGADRTIRVWNPFITASDLAVEELNGHESKIASLVVIDGYQMLISASADKQIKVWDLNAFVQLQKMHDPFQHRPVDRITCLLFDEHKRKLVSFGNRGRLWRVEERRLRAAEIAQREREEAVRAAKLRKALASQSAAETEGCDELLESGWSVVNVEKVARGLEAEYADTPYMVMPPLKMLTGDKSDEVVPREEIENMKWLEVHAELEKGRELGMGETVVSALYSRVFDQLVAVGTQSAFVFKMQNGEMVTKFQIAMGAPITSASLDRSQRRLLTGAHDGRVRSWNFNSGVMMSEYPRQVKEVTSVACIPNGRFIHRPVVAAGWDRDVVMYADVQEGDEVPDPVTLSGHRADILCLEVCDRGRRGEGSSQLLVCSGDADGNVMMWVATNGRLECHFTSLQLGRGSRASSAHSGSGGGGGGGNLAAIAEGAAGGAGAGEGENLANKDDAVDSLHYLAAHDCLLVGVASGHVHAISLWGERDRFATVDPDVFPDEPAPGNIDENTPASSLSLGQVPDAASCIASNATGTRVFIGESSGALQMWNVKRQGRLPVFGRVRRFQGHWRAVVGIMCSPKSRLIASVGGDGSARIWSAKGKPLHLCGPGVTATAWPKWIEPGFVQDVVEWDEKGHMHITSGGKPKANTSSLMRTETVDTEALDLASPPPPQDADGASSVTSQERPRVPFHVLCPPIVPKTLSQGSDRSSKALAAFNKSSADQRRREEEEAQGEAEAERPHPLRHMSLFQDLDKMHSEASVEITAEQKQAMADLERRFAGLLAGPTGFPAGIKVADILPQGTSPQETCQRLEDHCSLIEVVNRSRLFIKDLFRTYAAYTLTKIDSLNSIQLDEFRAFCKDTRCSQRALSKIPAIFTLANRYDEAESGGDAPDRGPDDGLVLSEFVECIIRVAREQIPGKDHLPKKVTMFLQNVARHCKIASRDATPLSNEAGVGKVIKKNGFKLQKIFEKYAEADKGDGKRSTMSLKELYVLMKDSAQMDAKFSIPKLAVAFIAANACSEANDDGTWDEWDWELGYDEFVECVVRVVDIKTKTAEGVLSEKCDHFITNVLCKQLL